MVWTGLVTDATGKPCSGAEVLVGGSLELDPAEVMLVRRFGPMAQRSKTISYEDSCLSTIFRPTIIRSLTTDQSGEFTITSDMRSIRPGLRVWARSVGTYWSFAVLERPALGSEGRLVLELEAFDPSRWTDGFALLYRDEGASNEPFNYGSENGRDSGTLEADKDGAFYLFCEDPGAYWIEADRLYNDGVNPLRLSGLLPGDWGVEFRLRE